MAKPNDPDGTTDPTGNERERDPHDPVSRFAPHLREELETIRRSEEQIVKALQDPEVASRFAADPARTLEQIGVNVPPAIKARLRANGPQLPLPSERRFRVPNGQVVTARVNVRFTRSKEG